MTSLDQYFHFGRPVSTEKPPSWMIQYTGAGEAEYGFLNYGQISAFRCFTLSYHLFNFCLFCTNLKSNYREREKVFNVLVRFERATAASLDKLKPDVKDATQFSNTGRMYASTLAICYGIPRRITSVLIGSGAFKSQPRVIMKYWHRKQLLLSYHKIWYPLSL